MEVGLTESHGIYEKLWNETVPLFKTGGLRIDPLLRNRRGDLRRGVTLVAWPDAAVQRKVEHFLNEAAAICPHQHFYKPAELHLTVLAVISNSVSWREQIHHLPAYRTILREVLKNRRSFAVQFRGVTTSPDALLIQGFPVDDSLTRLRDDLRDAFRRQGHVEHLDGRYKIGTAHLTAMRFATPEADWKHLLDFLQAHRETDFGETHFKTLQLIWGDWYASVGMVRTLQEYPLKD